MTTEVPYGDSPEETATLLLASAEKLKVHRREVRTTSKGLFVVPDAVADDAGFGEKKAPAKKAPAKKAAKKAPAKKAASSAETTKSEDKE
jgi:hypothetical protein